MAKKAPALIPIIAVLFKMMAGDLIRNTFFGSERHNIPTKLSVIAIIP